MRLLTQSMTGHPLAVGPETASLEHNVLLSHHILILIRDFFSKLGNRGRICRGNPVGLNDLVAWLLRGEDLRVA